MSDDAPRVFIDFVPNQHGRNIVAGICEFLRSGHPWETVLRYENPRQPWPDFSRERFSGFIGHVQTPAQLRALRQAGLPAVNVARVLPEVPLPCVYADNRAAGHLAARHFLERQYRRFGYLGPDGIAYSHDRFAGFRDELRRSGCEPAVLLIGTQRFNEDRLRPHEGQIRAWLEAMPRPFALFCCNDFFGRYCLDLARRLGWHVPADVAVLGVNNDLIYCEMAAIPLSSVELNGVRQGELAAQLLDELMSSRKPSGAPIWVPPSRVVERQSTDGLAVRDPIVARALRHLHEHAFGLVEIAKVAKLCGVSRRVLELRFRAQLGESPYTEVLRLRFERAKERLITTNLTVQEIAEQVGFQEARELHVLFRRRREISPGEYRRRYSVVGR